MSLWSQYTLTYSIEEALRALETAPGPALPVAGGTDLLLELQQGHHPPIHTLVDITRIPELGRLEIQPSTSFPRSAWERSRPPWERALFIGAAVPVRRVVDSPLVQEHALCVSEACELIGGPQVRNTATLGGNVAHALPAADGMIALVAMDAQAEIASAQGRRLEPILKLFRGPGESALRLDREILVGFHLPLKQPGQASAFGRVMRPQGVALPILNTAVWIEREEELIRDIRIAFGPSGPVPQRATELEKALLGEKYSREAVAKAVALISTSLHFRTSAYRASAGYRYQLGEVLLEDVLAAAWNRTEQVVRI
ncbi:MAG: FAD binding domain-containing protein [Chloroflexi bacterium]|nr:FAD binding domain-containing protein [Chloroflexota bacterium]